MNKLKLDLNILRDKEWVEYENSGYPCRVTLEDAEIEKKVFLIPYDFHRTNSPYQSKGPVFVRKGLKSRKFKNNEVPVMLNHRLLSFRGYDKSGFMKEAITDKGIHTKEVIEKIFLNTEIEYIHIHNSSPGCYNYEIRRINID